jgi:transposase
MPDSLSGRFGSPFGDSYECREPSSLGLFHSRCKSAENCALVLGVACTMKKSTHWAPTPNLTIMTVERHEADWAVSVSGGDHAACPLCGVRSHSRHSSYRRTLRDLPAQGTPVEVRAQMTRWRCRNERCGRRIFAERIAGLAAPIARRTTPLAGIVLLFGHSAGGRPS